MTGSKKMGRVLRAPENFVDDALAHQITTDGLNAERRGFLRKSFLAASAALASGSALAQANKGEAFAGDPHILNLPEHAKTLGKPVATNPYGMPSKFETNLLRRESPGLTRVSAASVSFTPLQGLFGIITPSGLHFERHHQGWVDIDPSTHRFMINGLVKNPKVYTMDDLMRLPSVSRMHFIECGANTAMEWGNVSVPTVQYSHGMLSCSEFTGVPLSVLLEDCGYDKKNGKFVLAEGADGSGMTRTIPIERALDDVMVAWGMNGEMLRPENGYPLRLVVPGVQGVSWVKWLRRIEVGDKPYAHQGRGDPLHRRHAGRHVPPVHLDPGVQVGDHHALGRADAAGQGLLQHHRPRLVGPRQGQAGRRLGRRRPQLAHRAPGDAGARQMPDALQHRLELGRLAGGAAVARHRRHRLCTAEDQRVARGARHPLDLSQQCDPVVESRRVGRGIECPGVLTPPPRWRWRCAAGAAFAQGYSQCRPRRRRRRKSRPGTSTCVRISRGCPAGSGTVAKGMQVWEGKCASCHGTFGESNEVFTPIIGGTTKDDIKTGRVAALANGKQPQRTTIMKVPTVSTLWDYINRAMPWTAPKSLTTEEVYAVTAYLLNMAEIVPDDFTLVRPEYRRSAEADAQPQRHDDCSTACGT